MDKAGLLILCEDTDTSDLLVSLGRRQWLDKTNDIKWKQGDQIGRLFSSGSFFTYWRRSHFRWKMCINFDKSRVGLHFGRLLQQAHLVTLKENDSNGNQPKLYGRIVLASNQLKYGQIQSIYYTYMYYIVHLCRYYKHKQNIKYPLRWKILTPNLQTLLSEKVHWTIGKHIKAQNLCWKRYRFKYVDT
jgi:hypothetical protein